MSHFASQSEEQSEPQSLGNAADIIERFGGIRPMATKIGVAVTTIQGWKKRGVIPANRVAAVLAAAKVQGIEIGDVVGDVVQLDAAVATVTESVGPIAMSSPTRPLSPAEAAVALVTESVGPIAMSSPTKPSSSVPSHDDRYEEIKIQQQTLRDAEKPKTKPYAELVMEERGKGVPKTTYAVLAGVILVGAAIIGLLIPKGDNLSVDVANLTIPVREPITPQAEEELFKGFVPEDWSARLEELKNNATQKATEITETAQAVHEDLLGENAGTTQERLVKLESYVNNVVGETSFGNLQERFSEMSQSLTGQDYLEQSVSSLHGMVMGGAQDKPLNEAEWNAKLDEARKNDLHLSETLTGVPQQDLKAAAMLLTMTQLRESLNRDKVPFEKDLVTLQNMVGDSDPALMASLDRLAPRAKEGVLTPKGISDELRTLTGEVLSDTLNGEDVSMVDRARDRMNDVFKIEKNGEVLTGSRQQKIAAEAQKKIKDGQFKEAIAYIRSLMDVKELEYLRPWLREMDKGLTKALEIYERANKKIESGDYEAALNILKKELIGRELMILKPLLDELEGLLSTSNNSLTKALTDIEEAIKKLMQMKDGQGYLGGQTLINVP